MAIAGCCGDVRRNDDYVETQFGGKFGPAIRSLPDGATIFEVETPRGSSKDGRQHLRGAKMRRLG